MNEIEELKKELEQTQLAYQMAAQMSQFKAGFLARTSHELRSPLSSMIGLHQLILSDLCESPEEQKEFIAQAYKSALKLMKLIDEIVTVAKTEYGTNKLNLESLQVREVLNYIYQLTHLQAANRNLKLQILPPEESLYVYADHPRLVQSIINLIDSGISLMKDGTIQVTADALSELNLCKITLDLDCPLQIWQEGINFQEQIPKIDLDKINDPSLSSKFSGQSPPTHLTLQDINISPGMKLLLSQTLLETMGGNLEILNLSSEDKNTSRTRIILLCKQPSC